MLFRKDYYAQRQLSAATTSSSAVSSEQGEPPEDPDSILATSGSQLPVPSSTSEQPVVPEEEEEDEEDVIGKRKLNFLFSISRKKIVLVNKLLICIFREIKDRLKLCMAHMYLYFLYFRKC